MLEFIQMQFLFFYKFFLQKQRKEKLFILFHFLLVELLEHIVRFIHASNVCAVQKPVELCVGAVACSLSNWGVGIMDDGFE